MESLILLGFISLLFSISGAILKFINNQKVKKSLSTHLNRRILDDYKMTLNNINLIILKRDIEKTKQYIYLD